MAIPVTKKKKKKRRFQRVKICRFCADQVEFIDYKDVKRLRNLTSERGKIIPRRISGNCRRHQLQLTIAVKRARNIALMPFTLEH